MLYANLPRVVRPRVEYALTTQTLGVEHSFTGTLTQDGERHDGASRKLGSLIQYILNGMNGA